MSAPVRGAPSRAAGEEGGTVTPDSPISRFLAGSEERIEDLLIAHRIPPEDTAELLNQALSTLVYRWGELGDPEAWLDATLRTHCQRYWRSRGRSAPGQRGDADSGGVVLDFESPASP